MRVLNRNSTEESFAIGSKDSQNRVFSMSPEKNIWHSLPIDSIYDTLDTSKIGLTQISAVERLHRYGSNRLSPPKKRSPVIHFLSQFHNLLIYVLLGAGVITAFLNHWVDAGVIFGVVIINGLIGFIQEGKAEKALEAIRVMLSPNASVMRDGKKKQIPAGDLVPGDLVNLQSGDKVPADIRLAIVKDLRIDEAALTGESVPVEKTVLPVLESVAIGDRHCMAYSGTLVTYGQGSGVVVETGDRTELGRINALLKKVQPLTTRLLLQISEFGKQLTIAILTMAVLTWLFGVYIRDYAYIEMFLACVGLAVAAIPEGLPAIISITLAIGVQRMARRHAIIRRLPAVETLGSVTVVCSDKTGTLTRNEMTVQTVTTKDHFITVTGAGYEPEGKLYLNDREVSSVEYPVLNPLIQASILCNDSEVHSEGGSWKVHGDPTEAALLTLAMKAGVNLHDYRNQHPRFDSIPFESEYRYMATLNQDREGHKVIYVKGAPEKILDLSAYQWSSQGEETLEREFWTQQIERLAKSGQRTLAIAYKSATELATVNHQDVSHGLTLMGFVGIMDPPREEAIEAIRQCRSAGIRVKMITGDHALTASSIGLKMGIGDGETVISGEELQKVDDDYLRVLVQKSDVFARVSPEHKLRLVQALQANGEVVSMTGDGVNDAPALKRADVGVAMGIKGTEVAKEAAEVVLTDDNFASIAHAVEEGRTVYDNIQKAIIFILPTNVAEAGIIIAAIFSGRMLPITPVQILWINMITAITLALALAFEPAENGVMTRTPRDPKEPLINQFLIWRIFFVAAIAIAGTYGLFAWERKAGTDINVARTIAVNALVMFEAFYLLNSRYLFESTLKISGLKSNKFIYISIGLVILAQALFTYTKPMQKLFSTNGIDPAHWVRIILLGLTVFFLVELEKLFVRRQKRRIESIPSQLLTTRRL